MNALTGLDGLPMVIVECTVTTIYTCEELYRSFRMVPLISQSFGRVQDFVHYG
jgi:hypothetical protein